MKKTISGEVKVYSIKFSFDVLEAPKQVFTGMAHGLYEDEAKELFLSRNPSAIIESIYEIKLKN